MSVILIPMITLNTILSYNEEMNAYVLALMANLSFAFGTQFFTHYSRKISPLWMNAFKACVACIGFNIMVLATGGWHEVSLTAVGLFFISGFLALGLGDVFLLSAFSHIGPGRTMILFSFQPLLVGIFSFFLFGQKVDWTKLWAIIFFISCIFIFAIETFKAKGHWDMKGILHAFIGMFMDGIGIIITRSAFEMAEGVSSFEGNVYRVVGALTFYFATSFMRPYRFKENWNNLNKNSKLYVSIGAFFGTFCSLSFFLMAVQTANLATLTALSITSTILASLFECVWQKTWPSFYLKISLIPFVLGMYLVLR